MPVPVAPSIFQQYSSQLSGYPSFLPWDQVQGLFGVEPGLVFIEDFDLGVVKTMGAYVDTDTPVDEQGFVLRVDGLKEDAQRVDKLGNPLVPVTFAHPESFMNIWTLPGVFIRRESIEPDLLRYSQELEAFRVPAPQAKYTTIDGQTGPDAVMSRPRAEAYNFIYNIDMIARYRTDANALLRAVLPRFKQHKAILVQDSKGDLSEYTSLLESIDQIDEILGVTLKHHGYSLVIKVLGELDLPIPQDYPGQPQVNEIRKTVQQVDLEVVPMGTYPPQPPATTSDGWPLRLYPSMTLGKPCTHLKTPYWQTGLFGSR